ncbi:MAG: hypothetical protein K2W95_05805 [Candidatus Obscuribacterales bacterium]|nr:hypothetical protein [Candidatus Obscuribacterales bacterium]
MIQKFIGGGLALVGLVAIGTGLFIFVTQPLIQGDPNGTLIKTVFCGIGGCFAVAAGYALADESDKKKNKDE